ncbi:MAG: rhomboid family intramembrane serine protease, partial [Odoribacteraceae bacterium]|nr:rhomboid family intramembrane serine protease [Odoribacteraceae bacterium]
MTFTVYIIAATVLVSIACFNNAALSRRLAFSPYRAVRHGEWYRLLTHGFVHADWMHLFVNMFTFYSFGLYIESVFLDLSGSVVPFLLLYFGGMIVASLHDFKQRADPRYSSIGASGAVSAVLFSAIFLDPWNKIYLFAAIPIPGILFGLCYLFYCHYMAKQSNDNINHHAHLFGAIYGFIFPPFLDSSLI